MRATSGGVTGTAAVVVTLPSIALTAVGDSIEAGQAGSASITVSRTNTSAPVTLALVNPPVGITGTFSDPVSSTPGTERRDLQLIVADSVSPATYQLTVRATAAGTPDAVAQVALVVTPAFVITLGAPSLSVSPGAGSATTVLRLSKGSFARPVQLSSTGAPSGISVGITPSTGVLDSAIVSIAAVGAVPAGQYSVMITASAPPFASQSASIALTVAPPPLTTSAKLYFCGPSSNVPIWLAQQDVQGTWREVTRNADSTFTVSVPNQGGVAYVTPNGTGYILTLRYDLLHELIAGCISNTKTLTGTVVGLRTPTELAQVAVGTAPALTFPSQAAPHFTVGNVPLGDVSVFATRSDFNPTNLRAEVNRVYLQRSINLPNGGVLDTVDFGHSTRSFAPAQRQVVVTGALAGDQITSTVNFATLHGGFAGLGSFPGSSPFTHQAIPDNMTVAGDLHQLSALASSATGANSEGRSVVAYRERMSASTTLSLGPVLATPTHTTQFTAPYVRMRFQLPRQPEYNNSWNATFSQPGHAVYITVDEVHMGAATSFDVTVPDFSGVSGWQHAWGPVAGAQGLWSFAAAGWLTGHGLLVDGATSRIAIRSGLFIP